ncbi:TolB-like translocation protein [Nisaea sediminum]|uniref:hypothetical protein n=1 Tax=Nisaea sediminum TaxID=2775867 RepID=UPI001868B1B0|nr:hypothetical protein [Nisaea sediminum]
MVEPEHIPAGVCDRDGKLGALERDDGSVDIVDLQTGERLSHIVGLSHALLIDGGFLYGGWADPGTPHTFVLKKIDLGAKALPVVASHEISLPAWVDAQAKDETRFRIRVAMEDGRFVIWWRGRDVYEGGAPPPAFLEQQIASNQSAECLTFDAETLEEISRFPEDGFAEEDRAKEAGARLTRTANANVYRRGGAYENAPWGDRSERRALFLAEGAGAPRLMIRRLKGDEPTPEADRDAVSLPAASGPDTVPELSLDGRHLAVASGQSARWHVYSVSKGTELGSLERSSEPVSFRVLGERMLWLEESEPSMDAEGQTVRERAIHAVSLADGQRLWTYPLPPKKLPEGFGFLPP